MGFCSCSAVMSLPAVQESQEMWVQPLGQEDPLKESKVTHSSILAWSIPWTEEPGGLWSIRLQKAGHDWSALPCTHTHIDIHTSDNSKQDGDLDYFVNELLILMKCPFTVVFHYILFILRCFFNNNIIYYYFKNYVLEPLYILKFSEYNNNKKFELEIFWEYRIHQLMDNYL